MRPTSCFGWSSTFGGLVETPNISKLADNGLRYVNHHTTALCSPTRACLLTGRNHHSVGMANITELATGFPGYNGRQPQDKAGIGALAKWSFDEDHWELYDLEKDPSECHDLMEGRDRSNLSDPYVKKMIELVGLWWAEAGRYGVLPLDDRFQERSLARQGLDSGRTEFTLFPGAVRIPEHAAPNTLNRSWSAEAHIEIPSAGASGPLVVMGGDTNGWSLYLKESVPTFCYNLAGAEYTYVRGTKALGPGPHSVRYEFEKEGSEPFGAGGQGRLFVDKQLVAEGKIPRTAAFGYSLDETFDVGCDKGSPVTSEYAALAAFTGRLQKVVINLKPQFQPEAQRHGAEKLKQAFLRE